MSEPKKSPWERHGTCVRCHKFTKWMRTRGLCRYCERVLYEGNPWPGYRLAKEARRLLAPLDLLVRRKT